MNLDKLTDIIKNHEGFVSHAYQDHLGFWTIGYGRLIDKRRGGGISRDEAEHLLNKDVVRVYQTMRANIDGFDLFPENIQIALCDMGYQLGPRGVLNFKKMIAAIKKGDYWLAAKEALDSRWAQQTPNRADFIANLIRNS